MRKEFKCFKIGLAALVVMVWVTVPALAAEVDFTVSPVLPENQRDAVRGYFDLFVEPGQKQDLDIVVENRANEEITVEVEAITASTNANGVVNYTTPGENHSSIPYAISDLVTVAQPVITIPANTVTTFQVTVEMPEEPYKGYLLGSVHVKKRLSDEELNSGQTILNQYSYVIALKLTQEQKAVDNDFLLESVQVELVNGRASIVNRIVNPQPVLVKGMDTTVKIFSKGSDTPVMERTMEKADMAPNSLFPFTLVDDAGYGIKAGTYLSQVEISYNDETWSFEQEFTIKAEEAAAINNNAVNLETKQTAMTSYMPMWALIALIVGAVLFVAIIILLIYLIRRINSVKGKKS